jgi:hypothetical protein
MQLWERVVHSCIFNDLEGARHVLGMPFLVILRGGLSRYDALQILRGELGDMGWFSKKPSWEVQYAQNIYDGLVAHNDFGDITALKLRIPTALHQAYQNKILLQREMICFAALMQTANPDTQLPSVMLAFGNLLERKVAERGLQMNRDQIANASLDDAEAMLTEPYPWAQRWLSEFRDNPNDTYMVALFADHCLRLHHAYKKGLEQTRPR